MPASNSAASGPPPYELHFFLVEIMHSAHGIRSTVPVCGIVAVPQATLNVDAFVRDNQAHAARLRAQSLNLAELFRMAVFDPEALDFGVELPDESLRHSSPPQSCELCKASCMALISPADYASAALGLQRWVAISFSGTISRARLEEILNTHGGIDLLHHG